jgi:hypothetical protein
MGPKFCVLDEVLVYLYRKGSVGPCVKQMWSYTIDPTISPLIGYDYNSEVETVLEWL